MAQKKKSTKAKATSMATEPARRASKGIVCGMTHQRHSWGKDPLVPMPSCIRCGAANPRWDKLNCAVEIKGQVCRRTESGHRNMKSHTFDGKPTDLRRPPSDLATD